MRLIHEFGRLGTRGLTLLVVGVSGVLTLEAAPALGQVSLPYFNDFEEVGDDADFSISTQPDADGDETLPVWEFNMEPDVPLGVFRNRNGAPDDPDTSNNRSSAAVQVLGGGAQDLLMSTTFQVKDRGFSGGTTFGLAARATGPDFLEPANNESYYYFDTQIRNGRVRIRKVTPDGVGGTNDDELLRRTFNGNDDMFDPAEEVAGAYDIRENDPDFMDPAPGGDFRDFVMSLLIEDILVDGSPAVRLTGTIEAFAPDRDENGDLFNPADPPPTLVVDTFTVIDSSDVLAGDYFGMRNRGGQNAVGGTYTVDYLDFSIESVGAPGLAGDFNEDGVVDAIDYALWRENLNSGTALPNDDGLGAPIDGQHFDLWLANYGAGAPGQSGVVTTTPEPSVLLLSVLGLGAALLSRRPR